MRNEYAKALGERLRRIRLQKGMSLQDVQDASRDRWKAAVVGAYERGDRNVTVPRLAELAEFYGVPVRELLPGEPPAPAAAGDTKRLVLDLEGLRRLPRSDRDPLERLAAAIQVQRGDFNGRVLTLRQGDLMVLGLLYQTPAEEIFKKLERWGVLAGL